MAIIAGGIVLSLPDRETGGTGWIGPIAVAAACLCWAIDNNLTRKVLASDALFIAACKGLIAGSVNCLLALSLGAMLPNAMGTMAIMAVGLLGYGVSLVLFVLALRGLGTARTGAYFSTAPFVGAVVALALLGESTPRHFGLLLALWVSGCGCTLPSTTIMNTHMNQLSMPIVIPTTSTTSISTISSGMAATYPRPLRKRRVVLGRS